MIATVQQGLARSESDGQRRMRELHRRRSPDNLEIYPNLWAGVGLRPRRRRARRWSAATRRSPTGSRSTPRWASTEFILSGYPHLEEAYWFGEGVLPVLRQRGLWQHPDRTRDDTLNVTPFAPTSGPRAPG